MGALLPPRDLPPVSGLSRGSAHVALPPSRTTVCCSQPPAARRFARRKPRAASAPRLPDVTHGAAAISSAGGNKQSARLGSAAIQARSTPLHCTRQHAGPWLDHTYVPRRPRGEAGSGRWLSGREQLASGPALQLGFLPRSVPSRGTASPLISALGWVGCASSPERANYFPNYCVARPAGRS